MNALLLTAVAATTGLEISTGIPLYILVPLIMVVAIGSVAGIMWLYKKLNKNEK